MVEVNAALDAVTKKVLVSNFEPVLYGVAGAVAYYFVAPYITPYLDKIPVINQAPAEFQPVIVAAVVVLAGYLLKQNEVMALGSGMAMSGLIMALAPKAVDTVSSKK